MRVGLTVGQLDQCESAHSTIRLSDCQTVRLLLGFLLVAQPAVSQSRIWRPEERVVLRNYNHILQVAATNIGVFAATRGGLIAYDSRFDQWLPPITELDGFPESETVALLGDPSDETLWIGTVDGVVHYMPMLHRVHRIAIPQGVQGLMFDQSDPFRGLYVRTPQEWMLIPRGSGVAMRALDLPPAGRRLVSSTLEGVLRRFPAADPLQAVSLFEAGRQYRYTSGAADPMNRNAYFGTNGLGLMRYVGGVARLERMPFGLLADGVGAIVVADGGVWVGTTPDSRFPTPYVPGFSWISEDLGRSRLDRGTGAIGYTFREVRDIVGWEDQFWAATDVGVVRLGARGSSTIDRRAGLPANDTYALAATADGLWVGTSRGLVLLRDGGATVEPAEATLGAGAGAGVLISAIVADGRSLWAGGPNGLLFLPDGTERVTIPALTSGEPLLLEPVAALAVSQGHPVMATRDRILWRNSDGRWVQESPLGGLGRIRALAADGDGVWVGGELGVQYFRFGTREFLGVAGPGDLPGAVRDLAISGDLIWVGTERGLVRIEKRAVGL